jgi:hypothetical protein
LAGSIQGTRDWQAEAIQILGELSPDIDIANPRATKFRGALDAQLQFERAFTARAARNGVLLFMLTAEISHRCNRTYAAQMRFELGEWVVKATLGLARVVVGIEKGFTGGPYLQRRFLLDYPSVPVCRALRQTCAAAVEKLQNGGPQLLYPRRLEDMFVPHSFTKNNG